MAARGARGPRCGARAQRPLDGMRAWNPHESGSASCGALPQASARGVSQTLGAGLSRRTWVRASAP